MSRGPSTEQLPQAEAVRLHVRRKFVNVATAPVEGDLIPGPQSSSARKELYKEAHP